MERVLVLVVMMGLVGCGDDDAMPELDDSRLGRAAKSSRWPPDPPLFLFCGRPSHGSFPGPRGAPVAVIFAPMTDERVLQAHINERIAESRSLSTTTIMQHANKL